MLISAPAASTVGAARVAPSIAPVPPWTPIDRVNDLVHVAWRSAMDVVLRPDAADRSLLLAGAGAARAGVELLLGSVVPNRPEEGWLRKAAHALEIGEANLLRCVGVLDAAAAGGVVDRAQLVRFAEQAEGDFDYVWELIASDS